MPVLDSLKVFVFNKWIIGLVAFVVLVVILFNLGNLQMNRKIQREINALVKDITTSGERITEEDLEALPQPVQKWLTQIGVVGKEPIDSAYFKQTGQLRLNSDQQWMTPFAEQYVNVQQPGFLWHVDIAMMPILNTKGRDLFTNGEGFMEIKIGSLIPVVNEKPSAKLNESALARFLLEIPMYPTAALKDYISWEEIDDNSAMATMKYKGLETSATFVFADNGELLRVEAMRYKETDDAAERLLCIGKITAHEEVDGIKIPSKIEISWILDEGEFTWYKIEMYDIKFNQ